MDHSTAHPSGLRNPSDPAEGIPPEQESDHPPKTPPKSLPVPTPRSKPEKLEAKLTPLQKRRLKTLKEKGKTIKVPSPPYPHLTPPVRNSQRNQGRPHLPLLLKLE